MAGNYPDPPGNRLAYDKDGTIVLSVSTAGDAVVRTLNAAEIAQMNDDGIAAPATGNLYQVTLIFPTPRTLTHCYAAWVNPSLANPFAQASTDTTNGIDGTWQTVTGPTNNTGGYTKVGARSPVAITAGATAIKAIRFRETFGNRSFQALHLYGFPTAAGDRLEFWHPTLDQPLRQTPAHLDWGNRPRGSSAVRQVRVKNLSSGLTAAGISVAPEALTPATPTLESQTQLRIGGGAYGASVAIPSLAPGQISGVIDVKQDLLAGAALGLWSQRLLATPTSWS